MSISEILILYPFVGLFVGLAFVGMCESRSQIEFTDQQGFGTLIGGAMLWPLSLIVIIAVGVIWLGKGLVHGVRQL